MARVTTRRRQPATESESGGDIFAHFERHGRSLNDGTAPTPAQKTEVDNAALIERISRLEGSLEEARARGPYAAPAQPAQNQTRVAAKDVKFDPTGLPDPLEDKDKYNSELAIRINAAMAAQAEAVRQEVTQKFQGEGASERLWNGFTKQHSEWADYPELVETVAVRVTQDAIAKGIDPQKYMFQNTEAFYADVAKQLNDRYGAVVEGREDNGFVQPDRLPRRQRQTDPNEDDGRAVATFGGQESGGRYSQRRSAENEGPGMIEDLHAIQKKMGIF